MKREDIDPKNIRMEINVRPLGHILRSFEADYGRDELEKFMNGTGVPAEYFENENNWVSLEYHCNMLDRLVEYTGDPEIPYKYGLNSVKYIEALGILKTIHAAMSFVASPLSMYKTTVTIQDRYTKSGKFSMKEINKNKILMESRLLKDGFKQNKNNCLNMQGIFASFPTYYNLPYAEVKELQCAAEGAESCVYEISWQNQPQKKIKFFSLLIGIVVVYIIYAMVEWQIVSASAVLKIVLLLIPVAAFSMGHIIDYKRTIRDNTEVAEEQNKTTLDSLEEKQKLNEELQQTIDRRTEELKVTNKKLDKALIDLKKAEEDLALAEKMVGIGRLAAGVAHEINNPMGAVRNYLQDILEELREGDPRKERMLEAEKATEESKVLINDLLSFARTEENLYIIEIDVNEVIEKIIYKKQQDFSNPDIKIYKDLAPGLPIIKSDPMQINQVFSNIILNAFNAVKGNGEISVKTSSNRKGVHVEIKDNGEIIPREILDILFDPSEKRYYGIGRKDLGLAISYNIVKRFNGDMSAESSVGNGTIFKVAVPFSI